MKRFYFFIPMFFFASCGNADTEINIFLSDAERSIDKNKLLAFKNAPKDSALFYFKKFEYDFIKLYNNANYESILDDYFNAIHVINNPESRVYYLCFALYAKLNGKEIIVAEAIQDSYKERLKIKAKWDKKGELNDLKRIPVRR